MFIGHFALGFAGKKIASGPSLGTMFIATQFIDLLWPLFLLLGIESVKIDPGNTVFTPLDFVYYPFSHGFLSVVIWSLLFAAVYYGLKKNLKGALLLGGLVLSHWILDLITHRPDLPILFGDSLKVGLGMWNNLIVTLLFELALFAICIFIYLKVTFTRNKKGNYALWGLVVFLVLIYFSNVFGEAPPSEEPIAYLGFAQWILIAWGYWIDRNRVAKTNSS